VISPALRVLADAGFVSQAEAEGGRVVVDDLSRSHRVIRVTMPGRPAVVVKTVAPESLQFGRGLAAELLVYRLGAWVPGLKAVLPRQLLVDEAREVLVVADEGDGGPSLAEAVAAQPSEAARAAPLLGRAIGRWHHDTAGVTVAPATPAFILALVQTPETALTVLNSTARAVAARILADARLGDAIRSVSRTWAPTCLIHGDFKWDNCLRGPEGLRIVDWELAGYGDPAWDLGCALAEPTIATAAPPDDRVSVAFLRAHREAVGAAVGEPDGLLVRAARSLVARLLQASIEYAGASRAAGGVSGSLLSAAHAAARDPEAQAERWRRALA
jgi:Phosphotransferase enzyme family